jgi:hypothetical protein
LLIFGSDDGPQLAGYGGISPSSLGDNEWRLWCTFGDGNGAYKGAVNTGEALGAVGSAWIAVYWRGGDGRRMVGLGRGKLVMEVARAAIYMGFGSLSCMTRSRSGFYLQSNFNLLFGWDSEWSP